MGVWPWEPGGPRRTTHVTPHATSQLLLLLLLLLLQVLLHLLLLLVLLVLRPPSTIRMLLQRAERGMARRL